MFEIKEAPTNATKCDWCKMIIKKGSIRLRFAPSKGYNYYWHHDYGIKYLEGLLILLKKGDKKHKDKREEDKVRKEAGL
ncbi:MAG: hypothetical protein BAJALOKI2v1_80087 [Promethearchaeota archaeon]|nr:MAG: hypothetical protein BAJALOKI2v1_80087 [Candidatus Lokiarchaeota archaeon]